MTSKTRVSLGKRRAVAVAFMALLAFLGYKSVLPVLVEHLGVETEGTFIQKQTQFTRGTTSHYIEYSFMVDNERHTGSSEVSSEVHGFDFAGSVWSRVSYDRSSINALSGEADMTALAASYTSGPERALMVKYLRAFPMMNHLSQPSAEMGRLYLWLFGATLILGIALWVRSKRAGRDAEER